MRQERSVQASIFALYSGHEIGRELKAMSRWLDEHPRMTCAEMKSRTLGGRDYRLTRCFVAGCSSSIVS
jgi:IS5 family transposase